MNREQIIDWLLAGDVSIQYQTYRDLLGKKKPALQKQIATQGWGAALLSKQNPDGHWGKGFYSPRWTCSHYTILELKNMAIAADTPGIRPVVNRILKEERGFDGGINPASSKSASDTCVNGMVLNYASYFHASATRLKCVVDFILSMKMPDGGFNCRINRGGAVHSSMHTTLSVLEGIHEYKINGYQYRLKELKQVEKNAREFILMHHLYRSDRTGNIIKSDFLKFYYPCRWYYDILKAMDYFRSADVPYDERMADAIEIILNKRGRDGRWILPAVHTGNTYITMEKIGKPSRWNTLRALRVLDYTEVQK